MAFSKMLVEHPIFMCIAERRRRCVRSLPLWILMQHYILATSTFTCAETSVLSMASLFFGSVACAMSSVMNRPTLSSGIIESLVEFKLLQVFFVLNLQVFRNILYYGSFISQAILIERVFVDQRTVVLTRVIICYFWLAVQDLLKRFS